MKLKNFLKYVVMLGDVWSVISSVKGKEDSGECECECVCVCTVCITIALNYSNHFHKWALFSTLALWLLAGGGTRQTPVVWLYRETPVSGASKY